MNAPVSRVHWVLTTDTFASPAARMRAFWHYIVRGHRCEICVDCGKPVMPHTGSWWRAPDGLWAMLVGDPIGTLCPPCFTARGDRRGLPIRWVAVRDEWDGET